MKQFLYLVIVAVGFLSIFLISGFLGNGYLPSLWVNADTKIVFTKDVPYGSLPKQKLDLCMPVSLTEKVSGVIIIHGGGGDKSQHTSQCKDLAKNGFVAIAVNYREDPPPIWKVVMADNRAALAWLHARPEVDPTRIGAMGGSMGGYVSSLIGTVEDIDRAQCVNNNYGPTDFTDQSEWNDSPLYNDFVERFMGGVTYEQNPALYRQLSPLTHVSKDDAASWLFTRSTNDHLVPRTQMTKMIAALEKTGIRTESYEYNGTGGGHANNLPILAARKLYLKRLDFMTQCLKSL